MSITRIFRVRIDSQFRQEFEGKFSIDAMYKIREAPGFISASILKPSKWSPDEYAMISQWQNQESLKSFFGDNWNEAVITPSAEKFIVACWLHHFESWEQA